ARPAVYGWGWTVETVHGVGVVSTTRRRRPGRLGPGSAAPAATAKARGPAAAVTWNDAMTKPLSPAGVRPIGICPVPTLVPASADAPANVRPGTSTGFTTPSTLRIPRSTDGASGTPWTNRARASAPSVRS